MSHPLTPLLGPLRFASQRDFAALGAVKGLRVVLSSALGEAERAGLAPGLLAPLKAELASVDHDAAPLRQASLRRVIGALEATGLVLPPELRQVITSGRSPPQDRAAPGPQRPAPSRPPGTQAPPAPAASIPGSRLPAPAASGSRARASAPPAPGRQETEAVPVWRAKPPKPGPPPRVQGEAVPVWRAPPPGAKGTGGLAEAKGAERPARASPRGTETSVDGRSTAVGPRAANTRGRDALRTDGRQASAPRTSTASGAAPGAAASGPRPSEAGAPAKAKAKAATRARTGTKAASKAKPKAGAKKGVAAKVEARMLSIAPRNGPLSQPLGAMGEAINPRLLNALAKRGLHRLGDVLFMLPRRYEDRRRLARIAELTPGAFGVTVATVRAFEEVPVRQGGRRTWKAVLSDGSGSIAAVFFFGGPWLRSRFPIDRRLVLSGEVRASFGVREMVHPEVEPADDVEQSQIHFKRIVPVYPGFERHEQRAFRELAFRVCERHARAIEEPLPVRLRERLGLLPLGEALARLHFPEPREDLELLTGHQSEAHQRLAFDELFFLQLGLALKRQGVKVEPGIAFDTTHPRLARAKQILPFPLTGAQARVIAEIAADMARPEPMHRLIQGDVGSGKTAVAAMAAMLALQDGYQVAVMAPTELLAQQHQQTFERLLAPLGIHCTLVSASGKAKEKRAAREALADGSIRLAVGTHALLEDAVAFQKLGLVIIDEQHRFGVLQRHRLMQKGLRPDVVVMTATPIPRTLAMAVHGDLDVSVINELPPGRTPIQTRVFSEGQRDRAHALVEAELARGHQAYVVYPLVEESEKVDLTDATRGAQLLTERFPEQRVGLLHGRLSAEEKEAVMRDFREGRIRILVATTVVEVGVDVPNASVMVIESAERFGLSQLHQLRGRVGRGAAASHCVLVAGKAVSADGAARLGVMEASSDGFVIAERDLELRGPGELLGTRQSGVPELAVANLARDVALLELAQVEARRIVAADPTLSSPEHASLIRALEERWEGRLALAAVG